MKIPKVGDYIRFWQTLADGTERSYGGTVIEEHPGWNYRLIVFCVDGRKRSFSVSAVKGIDGYYKYEPRFVIYSNNLKDNL